MAEYRVETSDYNLRQSCRILTYNALGQLVPLADETGQPIEFMPVDAYRLGQHERRRLQQDIERVKVSAGKLEAIWPLRKRHPS